MKEVTVEKVLTVINFSEKFRITAEQLDQDFADLGIDSIKFVQIIVGLEEAFECEIPDSKLLISEMNTVQKIIDVLQALYHEQNPRMLR